MVGDILPARVSCWRQQKSKGINRDWIPDSYCFSFLCNLVCRVTKHCTLHLSTISLYTLMHCFSIHFWGMFSLLLEIAVLFLHIQISVSVSFQFREANCSLCFHMKIEWISVTSIRIAVPPNASTDVLGTWSSVIYNSIIPDWAAFKIHPVGIVQLQVTQD